MFRHTMLKATVLVSLQTMGSKNAQGETADTAPQKDEAAAASAKKADAEKAIAEVMAQAQSDMAKEAGAVRPRPPPVSRLPGSLGFVTEPITKGMPYLSKLAFPPLPPGFARAGLQATG